MKTETKCLVQFLIISNKSKNFRKKPKNRKKMQSEICGPHRISGQASWSFVIQCHLTAGVGATIVFLRKFVLYALSAKVGCDLGTVKYQR